MHSTAIMTTTRRREPWRPGPWAGRYPAAAAMVILFLVPYLVLSAALPSIEPTIGAQLHMTRQTLSLTAGVANGAYAAGTVLAVQAAQHAPQRRLLLGYGIVLVIGSILAASATDAGMFIAGHVLQGLCTSLLLSGPRRRCSLVSRRPSCAGPRWSLTSVFSGPSRRAR